MKTVLVDAVEGLIVSREKGGWKLFTEMQEILDAFPNKKIIVTNANKEEEKSFGLDRVPYEIFTLCHNPEKEDPSYFEKLLNHFNLSKDDVIYFEHNPEAVSSARQVGIVSFWYDSKKRNLVALDNFLKENL